MEPRKASFRSLFPVTDPDGADSSAVSSDIYDLLRAANGYLFTDDGIPPLRVINDLLGSCLSDLGISGGAEWESFSITEEEFFALLSHLQTPDGQKRFHLSRPAHVANPPENIRTVAEFSEWRIDEALKDSGHHLNQPDFLWVQGDGKRIPFREYWEAERARRAAAERDRQ